MMNQNSDKINITSKNRDDFRLLSDNIFSLADKGRITLDLLKDVSFYLNAFANFDAVEIIYAEKNKIFHCDAREEENPRFFCDTVRDRNSNFSIHNLLKLPNNCDQFTDSFPVEYQVEKLVQVVDVTDTDNRYSTIIQIAIPLGDMIKGIILAAYIYPVQISATVKDYIRNFSRSLGLALSHNQSQFELRERVKELTCMYGISNLLSNSDKKLSEILENIVTLLPPAWLYPEITEARITLDDNQYSTSGFNKTNFLQTAKITVNGKSRGQIEVSYLESRPELDEGVFLTEERHLIDSIAHEIALLVKRFEADKEKEKLQKQLQHADRLATIGQLAAGVAHELNEPLTGILGFAELLKDTQGIPEQAQSDIERIETASLHAREIVRKLLLFSRQVPTKRGKVNLNTEVDEVISFFIRRFTKNHVNIEKNIPSDLPLITADKSQIRQIMVNLFVNAIHAMPNGGILSIKSEHTNENVKLEISDTGIGMTSDTKEKAFLPFFTTKEINQGTGLGLSVVHGIIEAHNGSITLESTLGKGTTFSITLPIEQIKE